MEKKNPNQIPFKFVSRYVFSDTAIRIRKLYCDEKSVENLIMSTQLPYVFTNQPNPLIFNIYLKEELVEESYSKMSWLISNKNIQSPILLTFDLTENTIEKTVLVIFELEIIKRELIPEQFHNKIKITFTEICKEIIKIMEKELQNDNKDIYHYESKIFNYGREKIWEIITSFHCLMSQQGLIKNLSIQVPVNKEGCEISFIISSSNRLCKLKVNKYKNKEKDNKWILGIIPLFGPFEHIENNWTLIKLGENETLVTNTSKYVEHIDSEIIKKLTNEKTKTFLTIENCLKEKFGEKQKNDNIINIEDKKKK